jgi:hypothetical protein
MKLMNSIELTEIILDATNQGYNRAFPDTDSAYAFLSDVDANGVHAFDPFMLHEHKAGVLSDPHIRGFLHVKMTNTLDLVTFQFDISLDLFNALNEAELPEPSEAS